MVEISSDPEVMGGMPVISGTRVPVDNVVATFEAAQSIAQVKAAYPFLTEEQIEAAIAYRKEHPEKFVQHRLSHYNPTWVPKYQGFIRPAKSGE